MSNKRKRNQRERRLRIRSIRRNPPDFKKLAGALIELAQAQAEADAEAQHARREGAKHCQVQDHDEPPQAGAG
jgi:hypothetical protein